MYMILQLKYNIMLLVFKFYCTHGELFFTVVVPFLSVTFLVGSDPLIP
jgi:hypothetical protein